MSASGLTNCQDGFPLKAVAHEEKPPCPLSPLCQFLLTFICKDRTRSPPDLYILNLWSDVPCPVLFDGSHCTVGSIKREAKYDFSFSSLPLAESPSPTGWITGRGCSGNVCCIERKPQLVQSLDNSPDVGLMGGAWMELERHIPMSHSAEVAIPLSLTVCLLLHGLSEGKWRRKRGQEMAPGCKVYSGHPLSQIWM